MQDLMNEMQTLKTELHNSMKLLRQNGNAFAQAENKYQCIKAQTVAMMKADGCPMTEISLSIKGQTNVAEAMLNRDLAKVRYEANQEHINVVKLELRVLENQIAREWDNG